MDKYLIAHDLGTSGDKASLFSIEGKLVKSYTASYKTHYFHKIMQNRRRKTGGKQSAGQQRKLLRT